MGSTRIKGTKLVLKLGSPAVDHWADISSYELTNDEAPSDVTTFEDASVVGGLRQWKLTGSAIQSTATGSFWAYVWDNSGTSVAFTLAPHGNAVASVAQPHFTGTVVIGPKPPLGGEAGTGSYQFDFDWNVNGTPLKVTA